MKEKSETVLMSVHSEYSSRCHHCYSGMGVVSRYNEIESIPYHTPTPPVILVGVGPWGLLRRLNIMKTILQRGAQRPVPRSRRPRQLRLKRPQI
jgi:hypothetical protein